MISEWFFENFMVIGIVLSIIFIAIQIYKYVAIKYNLPLPKWIKESSFDQTWRMSDCEKCLCWLSDLWRISGGYLL